MSEQKKFRFHHIEEKVNKWDESAWAKRLRITSGVLWNLLLIFIVITLIITVFAASVGAGYFASLVSKEPLRSKEEMRKEIFTYEETSEIYTNGKYLRRVSADIERFKVNLQDVSPFVIDAVKATEDEYFEVHNGIVPKAIFRGLLQDVSNSSSQTGGSTLTQQLIKNQILTNEVSYERKAKELLLAMRLEHFMSKDEILEAYLNIIPYGRNANGTNVAGIEAAAQGIFNKSAKELTLPQAAYIAGIPQAPFAYTPFYNRNQGLKEQEYLKPGINRMKTVLFRMKETGYINEQQYNEAVAYDITKDFKKPGIPSSQHYPYLTDEIQRRTIEILARMHAKRDGIDPARLAEEANLAEKYDIIGERSMRNDGYRIYATVDLDLYDAMNETARNFSNYGVTYTDEVKNAETGEAQVVSYPVQVGAMMIENNTGRILSFVGGRDHEEEATNHATQSFRQNGSTMKPLLVFAPAIEYGRIGAGSPVVDVKFTGPGNWKPVNFLSNQELGIIPARQALATSQNLATARLYYDIMDQRPADFLAKMGFSRLIEADYHNASLSLGTITNGTTVEENTNAFATLANGGKFVKSYMIERIEDKNGNVIFQHNAEPVEVFSPQTAYITTDMLRDVPKYGTATNMKNNLNFGIDIAAKTGTTDSYSDAWLVGYNPNVSLGVWLGYKYQTLSLQGTGFSKYGTSNLRTTSLFAQLMNTANKTKPDLIGAQDRFQQPQGVVSRSFCGISGLAPSAACSSAGLVRSDLFNANVMVPSKADDSIISAASVWINGNRYAALPSTPPEFVSGGGVGVNQEFIDRMLGPLKGDASKLFKGNASYAASNVVGGAAFNADDAAPAPVSLSRSGQTLQWSASPSNDVVGYYVYRGGARVAAISSASGRAYTAASDGVYTVVAVDITGRLSGNSNALEITSEAPVQPNEPEVDTPEANNPAEPETPEQPMPEKPDKPSNGNGNGNGNNGDKPANGNNGSSNGNGSPGNGNGN